MRDLHIRRSHGQSIYPDMDMDCPICAKITGLGKSLINYYDHSRCNFCGRETGQTKGDFIKSYRASHMKLSRREFATKLGISPETLKKYEWVSPSPKVFKAAMRIIKSDLSRRVLGGSTGAEGGGRTHTEINPLPPQDSVSTNSTTSATFDKYV